MLKYVLGNKEAMDESRSPVNLVVLAEARRNCPAGGSLAYDAHGVFSGQAICSGYVLEMTEVCPGVSISTRTSIPRFKVCSIYARNDLVDY